MEIAEEKQILELATIQAIEKNGEVVIEKGKLEKTLSKENVTVEKSGKNFKVKFNNSKRLYRINQNGEVKYFEEIEPTDIYAKLDSDGTLYLRSNKKDGYEKGTKWNSRDILKVVIEEPIAPKTASNMFESCYNLTSIENIENLHTENVTSMYYMFYDCIKLEKLDTSNFDTSKVTNMRAMFAQCRSLKTLDLSNFNTQNVNSMLNMFYGCNNLISIDLSGFDTQKVTNMGWMFRGCSSLTSINLKNVDTSGVYEMDLMFAGCGKLTSIDLNSFNTAKVTSMGMMFNGCYSLIDLDISHFDTSKVTSMNAMFRSCSKLSNTSLNSILYMCQKGTQITNKTLKYLDMPPAKANMCNTLSNYDDFTGAGWSIGM